MWAPGGTTTFLSRMARRTTAPGPIRTPGMSTEPSTYAPCSDGARRARPPSAATVAPATIEPGADDRLLRDAALDELRRRQLRWWVKIGHCRL